MKKNIGLYLAVGLVVLLAIIILIFGLFFLNDKDPREVFDTYYLRFPQYQLLTILYLQFSFSKIYKSDYALGQH